MWLTQFIQPGRFCSTQYHYRSHIRIRIIYDRIRTDLSQFSSNVRCTRNSVVHLLLLVGCQRRTCRAGVACTSCLPLREGFMSSTRTRATEASLYSSSINIMLDSRHWSSSRLKASCCVVFFFLDEMQVTTSSAATDETDDLFCFCFFDAAGAQGTRTTDGAMVGW